MYFEICGRIRDVEVIAVGGAIRELARLQQRFGRGNWRKLKGVAEVKLADGRIRTAEIHWYAAHGIGKRKLKIKRLLG